MTRRYPSQQGFSLAEILFAMAITSFALLALVGVLPHGLEGMRAAEQRSAEARIVQYLTTRHQLLPWDTLMKQTGEVIEYFDIRGAPVHQGGMDAVFATKTKIMDGLPLPGEGTTENPYLKRLRIWIAPNVQLLGNPDRRRERWTTLVNMDKLPPIPASAEPGTDPGTGTPPSAAP